MKHSSRLFLLLVLLGMFSLGFAANNSIYLDGDGDYLTLGTDKTNDGMSGATGITVEAWINPSSLRAGTQRNVIVDFCRNGAYSMVMFYLSNSGRLRYGGRSTTADAFEGYETPAAVISAGSWQHVAGVLDFTNKTVRLYVDGVLVGSRTSVSFGSNTYVSTANGSQEFIGVNQGLTATQYYHGFIDDLRIWSAPRTQQQIQDNMFTTISQQSNLLGYWKFDEDSGSIAYDSSGSDYHATLMGNASFQNGNPVLPVELSSFTAVLTVENYVRIKWITQSETGISGYYVYRSQDSNWANAIKISEMITSANSSVQQTYQYTDNELTEDGMYYYWLQVQEMDGSTANHGPTSVNFSTIGGGAPDTPELVVASGITTIYPNPITPYSVINYNITKAVDVSFKVYNSRGQMIRSFNEGQKNPGSFHIGWDGRDSSGKESPNGIYFIKMQAGRDTSIRKTLIIK